MGDLSVYISTYNNLFYRFIGTGNPKICRIGWQTGDPEELMLHSYVPRQSGEEILLGGYPSLFS